MKRYLRGIHSSTVLTLSRIRNRISNQVNEKVSKVDDTTATEKTTDPADKKTSSESKSKGGPSGTTPIDEPYERFPGNPFDFSAFAGCSHDDLSLYPRILKSLSKDEMKLFKEGMERIRQVPSLKPIVQELETGGLDAFMRYRNDEDLLNKFVDASGLFQVNADGFFHAAASQGLIEGLKKAIASGADVNQKDAEGMTALHFACAKGHVECTKVLLEAGANVHAVDNNKNTAMHYVAAYGRKECVTLLFDYGGYLIGELKNSEGKTATEVATLNYQEGVLMEMLQYAVTKVVSSSF